ncbi:type II toxin-antitoxin system PemK/MazF family toxin [bacterium]|nr:type II toxin-antitoxin system PemK/MazF family toxin [bacterium]
MRRGEIWFAATPGGDRPVLVLTRTVRGVVSELELTPEKDGVPTPCVVNFDNLHTLPREVLRRRISALGAQRMAEACLALRSSMGC